MSHEDLPQLIDIERFLFDRMIPCDRKAALKNAFAATASRFKGNRIRLFCHHDTTIEAPPCGFDLRVGFAGPPGATGPAREAGSAPFEFRMHCWFQRLRHRRGPKKAICAVAASILSAVYHMLRDGTFYQDLGPDHFCRATQKDHVNRLVRQIAKLGFTCTLAPTAEREVSV